MNVIRNQADDKFRGKLLFWSRLNLLVKWKETCWIEYRWHCLRASIGHNGRLVTSLITRNRSSSPLTRHLFLLSHKLIYYFDQLYFALFLIVSVCLNQFILAYKYRKVAMDFIKVISLIWCVKVVCASAEDSTNNIIAEYCEMETTVEDFDYYLERWAVFWGF